MVKLCLNLVTKVIRTKYVHREQTDQQTLHENNMKQYYIHTTWTYYPSRFIFDLHSTSIAYTLSRLVTFCTQISFQFADCTNSIMHTTEYINVKTSNKSTLRKWLAHWNNTLSRVKTITIYNTAFNAWQSCLRFWKDFQLKGLRTNWASMLAHTGLSDKAIWQYEKL